MKRPEYIVHFISDDAYCWAPPALVEGQRVVESETEHFDAALGWVSVIPVGGTRVYGILRVDLQPLAG